jgi:hypothetical protein
MANPAKAQMELGSPEFSQPLDLDEVLDVVWLTPDAALEQTSHELDRTCFGAPRRTESR